MCRVCVEALGIETPLADSYWGKSIMVNRATEDAFQLIE